MLREVLKQQRLKKGLNQQELTSMMGISRVHYTQIENNSRSKKPSLDVAMSLKRVLDYPSDDLFLVSDVFEQNNLL